MIWLRNRSQCWERTSSVGKDSHVMNQWWLSLNSGFHAFQCQLRHRYDKKSLCREKQKGGAHKLVCDTMLYFLIFLIFQTFWTATNTCSKNFRMDCNCQHIIAIKQILSQDLPAVCYKYCHRWLTRTTKQTMKSWSSNNYSVTSHHNSRSLHSYNSEIWHQIFTSRLTKSLYKASGFVHWQFETV